MQDNVIVVSTVVIASLLLGLGMFVGLSHAKPAVKWSFTGLCIPLALWVVFNTLADIDLLRALLWTRLSFASVALGIASLAIFVLWFPDRRNRKAMRNTALIGASGIVTGLLSLSSLIVPKVEIVDGYANVVTGDAYMLYVAYVIVTVVGAVGVLIARFRRERGVDRERVKYVLIATAVTTVAAMLTNLIIPLITGSNPLAIYGSFAMLFFIMLVAYSVIRHRLFSIRVATARAVAYLLSGVTLGLGFGVVIFALDYSMFGDTETDFLQRSFYIFSAVVIGFSFPAIKRFFDNLTKHVFLRDFYDPELLLTKMASIIAVTKTSKLLMNKVTKELHDQMHLSFIEAYLKEGDEWVRKSTYGREHEVNRVLKIDEMLAASPKTIINLEHAETGSDSSEEMALIVILRTPQGTLGYITLGYKLSGVGFTKSDYDMLEAVASEVSIATENYLQLEAIASFNATLQQNVKDATSELRSSNKKLRRLDESKDEFISMASHQLRTPLTSIKGYISMVLDGDMGEITPQQRKVLEEAFASSQRMVYLIGDFLNVSRIQTGKFMLEKAPVQLSNIIEDEIDQLRATASARSIKLAYDPPQNFPKLELDENKMRQVMMNFIDNAIYYSPTNTTITISIVKHRDDVTFKVEDQGIGVPKSEQHQLFTKFYRASNARKQRPDGTGIGLFMAKKVIVAHGGSIIFETHEGKGSTFGFKLPLKAVTLQSAPAQPEATPAQV